MAGCSYDIGGNESFDLLDLTAHYYKTTNLLTNNKIFSSDEIIESTENLINYELLKRQSEIRNNTKLIAVHKYTSEPHKQIFESLGINKERLHPEYIESARIVNTLLENLKDVINFADVKKITKIEDFKDWLHLNPENRTQFNQYYKEILDTIELEQKTVKIGIMIHGILSQLITNNGEFDTKLENNLLKELEEHKDILDGDLKDWSKQFQLILSSVYNKLSRHGRILQNVAIDSKSDNAPVKGELDIIVIADDGTAHIYDLKLSKTNYDNWDSAKKLTTDYQLAFYRAMLGQYVRIDSTTLNLLPIELGKMTDGKLLLSNLRLNETVNRSGDGGMQYLNGAIYNTVRKLIPEKVFISEDPERKQRFLSNLELILPGYKVRTSNKKNDIDKMLATAMERGQYSFYNKYQDEYFGDTQIDAKGKNLQQIEEELKKLITDYVNFIEKIQNRNLISLKNKLITSINEKTQIIGDNDTQQIVLNNTLKNYITGEYTVIGNIEELNDLGFILLQNKKTSKFVLINVSSYTQKATFNKDMLYEDAEFMKSLLFFNDFAKELNLNLTGIEDIIVLNLEGAVVSSKIVQNQYDSFINLINKRGVEGHLKTTHISKITDSTNLLIRQSLRQYNGIHQEKLLGIFGGESQQFDQIELEKLKEMDKAMRTSFPKLAQRTMESELNFSDDVEYLFSLLQVMILTKSKYLPHGDFIGLKNFSIGFTDFQSLFASLYSDIQEEYDSTAKRIQGLPGGLKTVTPDRVGSKDLQNINVAISSANSMVAHAFGKQNIIVESLTKKFQEQSNYSSFQENFVGNGRKLHENLWLHENGRISNKWEVKNPYKFDEANQLTDPEREYLKKMLLNLNKFKKDLKITDEEYNKIDVTSLDSIKATDKSGKIIKAIESGKYFSMALIRSEQVDRNKGTFQKGAKALYGQVKSQFNDLLDTRNLTPDDIKYALNTQMGYYEMYDIYENQSQQFKTDMVNEETEDFWELNLDTIANKVAFSSIKKTYMDNILPIINSYVWYMKLSAGKNNQNISKELEYIVNRLQLGVYNVPIVADEAKDLIKVTSSIKKVTTAFILGFRPVLMVKEFGIGLFKGISLAATKIYGKDQFNLAEWTLSLKKMMTIDNKYSMEFNLIDRINHYYRFANMDIDTISTKMQRNRRGAFLGVGKWMYSCNTFPDYYNRLSLFIAKMIHDGSYDAHSLDEFGEIVYDAKKDKRFSHYLENREKNKNAQGQFIPSKTDKLYNTQRNLFNVIRGEINAERIRVGLNERTEEEGLEQAYSEKERQSYKSFTDSVYGYYDKDAQAEWHHTWYGLIFLQFLQFWPGKMNMWFGKPLKEQESNMGEHIQKMAQKPGDPEGKLSPVYLKPIYNEDDPDQIDSMDEVFEDTGDPCLVWTGTPQEGLIYSIGYTIQDVLRGNWGAIKDNDLRKRRVMFAMSDTLLMMLIFGLLKALFDGFVEENGTEGLAGNTAQFLQTVDKKILSEANLWQNTLGAIKTEPAFYSFGTKVAGDIQDVFNGDKSFNQLVAKNAKMFEFWDVE